MLFVFYFQGIPVIGVEPAQPAAGGPQQETGGQGQGQGQPAAGQGQGQTQSTGTGGKTSYSLSNFEM